MMFTRGRGARMWYAAIKKGATRKSPGTRFADKIVNLMGSVTHRCASTDEDRELIFRTRYQAYRRREKIDERIDLQLYDREYDNTPNAFLTMTSIRGEFASTFRIHVANTIEETLPSRAVFSDLIDPHLRAGYTVVDPTRLAARLEASRTYPELPFLALRPAWLTAVHFNADIVIATVAVEHMSFYRRVFGYEQLCEPRDYPLLHFKVVCLALDFPTVRDSVETRYPFFRSTKTERDELFGQRHVSPARSAGTWHGASVSARGLTST